MRLLTVQTSSPILLVCVLIFIFSHELASAQGRITFGADSLHLVYFTTDQHNLQPGDGGLAGQGLWQGTTTNFHDGATLLADLYSGTSSTSLVLVKTASFTNSASVGKWTPIFVTLPVGQPAGQTTYFQVQIRDSRDLGYYFGASPIFTAVPGANFANLWTHDSPSFSTWPDGTFIMDTQTGFEGSRGAIEVKLGGQPTPTPHPLLQIGVTGQVVTITWSNAVAGLTYRVQYNSNLTTTNWVSLTPDVYASNTTASKTNTPNPASATFYRVIVP
jgi:hypothetical protein